MRLFECFYFILLPLYAQKIENFMVKYLKKNYSWGIIIFFGLLYFLFLSNNPTSDSYANAFSSITKEELFRPHHLLYSAFGYLFYLPFQNTSIEPIRIFQTINVIFAMGCLALMRFMLLRLHLKEHPIAAAILFLGSCFGFQRFAIDNECYILSLFFTLLALNFIQSFLINNKTYKIVLCAFSSVIGCLFHQIVIFAWLCCFIVIIFNRKRKYFIYFFLISLIIPLTYALVVFLQEGSLSINSLMNFVLHDYLNSNAEMPILKNVLLLSSLSFVRTFFQVHGYIGSMISLYPTIGILIIAVSSIFFILGIIFLFKLTKRNLTLFNERRFVRLTWWLLIYSLAFAMFSNGNAEFMIIIPFLLVLLAAYYFENIRWNLFSFGFSMYAWNLFFALIPIGLLNTNSNKELAYLVLKEDAIFVLKDKVGVDNIVYYQQRNQNLTKTFKISEVSPEMFEEWVKENKTIYTDYFGGKETLSRAKLAKSNNNQIPSNSPIIKNKDKFYPKYKFFSLGQEKEIWTFISTFATSN